MREHPGLDAHLKRIREMNSKPVHPPAPPRDLHEEVQRRIEIGTEARRLADIARAEERERYERELRQRERPTAGWLVELAVAITVFYLTLVVTGPFEPGVDWQCKVPLAETLDICP